MGYSGSSFASVWPPMSGLFGWSGRTALIMNDRRTAASSVAPAPITLMSDNWQVAGWWRRSGVMRQAFDIGFLDAFAKFLAQPDPKGLPQRAHVLRYAGDPNRRTTRLPAILMAWMQQRCLDVDGEDRTARATMLRTAPTRRQPSSLRLLRATGTG